MAFLYPWGNTQQLNLDWILQKIKELEAGSGGADLDEVANALISASYAVQAYDRSDIVFRDGKLYRANQAIPAPGEAWTPAHWDEILLGDTVSNLVQYVAALSNDQIVNSSSVTGTHTSDALDTLKNAIDGITLDSDSVSNESQVTGDTVSDALNTLNTDIGAITPLDAAPTEDSTKGVTSGGVKTAIDATIEISPYDWISINTATVSTSSLNLRKVGNILILSGYLDLIGNVAGNNAVLGTFATLRPTGARRIYGYATYNGTEKFYFFSLNTDGTLTTATGGSSFAGQVVFADVPTTM